MCRVCLRMGLRNRHMLGALVRKWSDPVSPVFLQSLHMIAGQFLLVAPPRAVIADSGGSGGSPVAIGTGDGFGVSLVAGGSDLNLLQRSNRGQNGAIWRSLEPPEGTFILTGH